MSLVVTVTEIEPCHVHPRIHQLAQPLLAPRGRTDRTNDLGPTVQRVYRRRHLGKYKYVCVCVCVCVWSGTCDERRGDSSSTQHTNQTGRQRPTPTVPPQRTMSKVM
jgi:hypothetical protein